MQAAPTLLCPYVNPNDPYWSNVTLLLNFDNAAHRTRCAKTGIDWTLGEGASIDTVSPLSGSGSLVLPGYLNYNGFTVSSSNANDWTFEVTLKNTAFQSYYQRIFEYNDNSGYLSGFYISPTGHITLNSYLGGANILNVTTTGAISAGAKSQIAVVKHGGEISAFIGGVREVLATSSYMNIQGPRNWYFGRDANYADGTPSYLYGPQDEIRFTDTIARYTSNYTPSSSPFPAS